MHKSLESDLRESFGSIATLKEQMLDTANSMFGPGFVWLVKRKNRSYAKSYSFAVMNTYIAGSPLKGAHHRLQSLDSSSRQMADFDDLANAHIANKTDPRSLQGLRSKNEIKRVQTPPGGIEVIPTLCVNTWEHVWLPDWGIKGKEKFLEAWWETIDWDTVKNTSLTT